MIEKGSDIMMIGTMNVQNKFYLKKYDGKTKKQDNILLLKEFLKKYQVDILGMQEVTIWYYQRLEETLKGSYKVTGDFRLKTHLFKKYNEANPILTNQKIIKEQTFFLPFLPTLIPRILTINYLNTKEFGTICFLNTHLSFENKKVRKKQLKELLKYIKESNVPIILTGDFNMTIYNSLMKEFIKELAKLNISRVPIMEKTFKTHTKERAIDHIFLSDCFKVKKCQVIKEEKLKCFSDHYPVLVEITKRS